MPLTPNNLTEIRSAESICLLCKTNKANQTNSHIVPRFLTKSLFRGTKARGYIVGSKPDRIGIVQDTPKENHLICTECEKYFSQLEQEANKKLFEFFRSQQNQNYRNEISEFGFFRYKQFGRACFFVKSLLNGA